ncbi:hypothetical protein E2320_008931 [Naja naja]|nr:hypothetical protein E2320_008931 [Naja naja]
MGEIEGTYRVLQTPGSRLGVQKNSGVSTLEPGQNISSVMVSTSPRTYERSIQIKVKLLDNTQEVLDIESKCCGQKLLTEIFSRLNLVESDYFGIEFQNLQSYWIWLEPMKPIVKQVRRPKNTVLRLAVKFFPPDPGQLQEEYTRRRKKMENYVIRTPSKKSSSYLIFYNRKLGILMNQEITNILKTTNTFQIRKDCKKKYLHFTESMGETPAESDFQVLEIGRKLEMYGMRFHLASDREGTKINLAVSNMGVLVFQGPYQDTLEFLLGGRDECKNLWKICVEYHTFFRLSDQPKPKPKPVFFSRGSSFRYSGRTQKQLVDYVRESGLKKIPYERRHSKTRMSAHTLSPDAPKQSVSFTEGLRIPASNACTYASFHMDNLLPSNIASLSSLTESNSFFLEPRMSHGGSLSAEGNSTISEETGKKVVQQPASPNLHSFQGPQLSSFKVKSAVSLSPPLQETVIQGSSPLLSPVLSDVSGARFEEEDEMKHKKCPTDKAYFIAKEILATERTYLKDLEVLTLWFRSAVVKENAMPEGRSSSGKGDYQRIGDVMLRNVQILKEFTNYLQKHDEVLMELEKATKRIKKLEIVYKEFELQRVCYLPLNTFLLKPIHRIIYYKLILGRLCKHYPADHRDYTDCKNALKEIADMTSQLQNSLIRLENFQKLIELQHDLLGTDNLIAPGRFSDTLLYTSKGVTGTNQFKIRGHLPLHGMLLIVLDPPVEESENEWSVPHCFTIYSAQKTVVVAASTRLEMEKWLEDLNMAIEMAKKTVEKSGMFLENSLSNRSNRSSDEVSLEQESEEDIHSSRSSLDRQSHHRANTTIHVCWYRNTSVSMTDHSVAVENQLSGYLLRKFKNSNGWQKLWVVFTNFCLFFYKTHQDDYPLASLPLIGYTINMPTEEDGIQKDYVFKLQFKSHVYFFRAESKYTFERWVEVIKRATGSPGRSSLLTTKDEKESNIN